MPNFYQGCQTRDRGDNRVKALKKNEEVVDKLLRVWPLRSLFTQVVGVKEKG